ncbi:hypothetical protein [Erythrobacter sp. Alg231-14]
MQYACAEQFMMAAKAHFFGDTARAAAIMATPDPMVHKRIVAQA